MSFKGSVNFGDYAVFILVGQNEIIGFVVYVLAGEKEKEGLTAPLLNALQTLSMLVVEFLIRETFLTVGTAHQSWSGFLDTVTSLALHYAFQLRLLIIGDVADGPSCEAMQTLE